MLESALILALLLELCGEYNHIGQSIFVALRFAITGFFDLLLSTLRSLPGKARTGDEIRSKALLAVMGAADADEVILPASAVAYEERPLPPPFFASAHRSISPLCFCGAQHSFGFSAFADLSLSMMEVFSPFSEDLASAVLSSFGPLLMIPSIMP